MSNHRVDTFVLGAMTKHPNADTLSIVKIADTDYTYVAKTEDWNDRVGKVVAWVPPDSVVKLDRPEFSFLKDLKPSSTPKHPERIRAMKLRGVVSYGLLVLAPEGLKPGDDAAQALEVTHYQPPVKGVGGGGFQNTNDIPGPHALGYDVEHFLRYGRKVFQPGEKVYITEKIHGACGRYMFDDGVMYCGSRESWKSEFPLPRTDITREFLAEKGVSEERITDILHRLANPKKVRNLWWCALTPDLEQYCRDHPGHVVYGEVFGQVQNLTYGAKGDEVWFRAFDILLPGLKWMDAEEFRATQIIKVPEIAVEEFDFDRCLAYAEGNSTLAANIREGVVVKPLRERWHEEIGRVSLKVINPAYYQR